MARRQRGRATAEDAEETQRTILRTAQQLFMEYGYRAVSTRQLAAACGLTQPALYHYYADKQDLYVAMAQEEVAKLRVALDRLARRGDSVEERLQQVMLYLLGSTQHDLSLMLHDVRHELTSERTKTLNQAFQAGVVAPIAAIFADGLRQGLLRDRAHGGLDATTAAYLFLSMISAHLPQARTDDIQQAEHAQRTVSDAEMARQVVHVLLHGLATSPTL